MTEVGRVFRFIENAWVGLGDPLPPFSHAAPDSSRYLAPWVLPRQLQVQPGDVVAWREIAFRLLSRCADNSPEVQALAQQTLALHDAAEVQQWLSEIEVWLGMRIEPGRDWPEPPRSSAGAGSPVV